MEVYFNLSFKALQQIFVTKFAQSIHSLQESLADRLVLRTRMKVPKQMYRPIQIDAT